MVATANRPLTPKAPRLIKASDVVDAWGLNVLVYGAPGVGKTVFAASAQDHPDGKNVLIIDIEGGTRSIADREDVDIFRPEKFQELRDVFSWIANGDHEYQTIVIDSLTEAQALNLKEIVPEGRTPELQQWGKSNENMQSLVRNYKSLAQVKGFNVVFTARLAEITNQDTGITLRRPMLSPKAADAVVGIVDAVGFMEISQKGPETKRLLRFGGLNNTWAKVRQPVTIASLPITVGDPTMPRILDLLNNPASEE